MKKRKILIAIVFVLYLAILFRLTVFRTRSYPIEMSVNLSLFTDLVATYHENGLWMVIYLVVGNVVWFVPFGFLLPLIGQKLKAYHVISLGLCLSLVIELCQLVMAKGMFEIDDLVLNTFGAALGFCAFIVSKRLQK